MGATLDLNKPLESNPVDADLDQIRDNLNFLLMIAAHGSVILPGWQTTAISTSSPQDFSQPNSLILTRGTRAIHLKYTWADDAPTTIQMCYDDGVSGLVCFPAIGIAYDTDGNLKAISGLLDGMVSWWALEEASLSIRYDSHGSNDLTAIGGSGYPLQAVGLVGNCADFLGSAASRFEIGPSGLRTGDQDYTYAAWVNPSDVSSNNSIIYIGTGWPWPIANNDIWIRQDSGLLKFFMYASGVQHTLTVASPTMVTSTWYLVIISHEASTKTIRASINAGAETSLVYTGTAQNTGGDFHLGGDSQFAAQSWDGQIDETCCFDRLLTQAEREELYNAGAGIGYPG